MLEYQHLCHLAMTLSELEKTGNTRKPQRYFNG
jgi:hypothetical protein